MRSLLAFPLFFVLGFFGYFCGTPTEKQSSNVVTGALTLDEVQAAFAGMPIKDWTRFNAETDPNHLLGRPHNYIEKANFTDQRIRLDYEPDPALTKPTSHLNCTVEVFAAVEDARRRQAYVAEIAKVPMFTEYNFLHKNVLLRLDRKLTPTQAAEYERILSSL